MKIYTKTGDAGETGLFAGGRIRKDDARVEAYGSVDELNAVLGMARAQIADRHVDELLHRVVGELFCLGADLATPLEADSPWIVRVDDAMVARLEAEIDAFEVELEPLTNFILPGGAPSGAMLHFARTVCRRAERRTAGLASAARISAIPLRYLNRLSDWLFVLARLVNMREGAGEEPWISRP